MADTKVTALTEVTAVLGTDFVPVVASGNSAKVTVDNLNRKVTNNSIAAQALTAATLANITGTNLLIPLGTQHNVKTLFQWKIIHSKTAAGAAANVWHVRCGTLGTTADPIVFTFTTAIGTAAIDTARIDIMVTPRSVGTTGIWQGTFTLTHNLAATGMINIAANTITATSAALNTTTNNLIWSVTGTMGAAAVVTVNHATGEVVNI